MSLLPRTPSSNGGSAPGSPRCARAEGAQLRAAPPIDNFGPSRSTTTTTPMSTESGEGHHVFSTGLPNTGAAFVFDRENGVWKQSAMLRLAAPMQGAQFGWAVDIDGDLIVIGAPKAFGPLGGPSNNAGRAYVFERISGVWVESAELSDPTPSPGDAFGQSVAVHERTVAIGAPGSDTGASNSGEGYLFDDAIGSWSLLNTFHDTSSVASNGDRAGYSIDLDGDYLAIGSENGKGAWLYQRAGSTAVFLQDLPGPQFLDGNASVAVSNGRVAVGLPEFTGFGPSNSGAVDIWELTTGSWTSTRLLGSALGFGNGERFGRDVAFGPNELLVGSWFYNETGSGSNQGRLDLFGSILGTWSHRDAVIGCPGPDDTRLGASIAASGGQFLAGAPGNGAGRSAQGTFGPMGFSSAAHSLLPGPELFAGSSNQARMLLDFDPPFNSGVYVLVGSVSGTSTGIPIDGLLLPLVLDAYTQLTFQAPNATPLAGSIGSLPGNGDAQIDWQQNSFQLTGLAGTTFWHAALQIEIDPTGVPYVRAVSNAVFHRLTT